MVLLSTPCLFSDATIPHGENREEKARVALAELITVLNCSRPVSHLKHPNHKECQLLQSPTEPCGPAEASQPTGA